jgi:hypothetical protein
LMTDIALHRFVGWDRIRVHRNLKQESFQICDATVTKAAYSAGQKAKGRL